MMLQIVWPQLFEKGPAIVASLTTIASGIYNLKQARDKSILKDKVDDVEGGIVEPVRIKASESRNSIILLGLGKRQDLLDQTRFSTKERYARKNYCRIYDL